jgi:SnoaL-like domain
MDDRKIAELLERLATTRCSWDADAFIDLYAPDAESHDDPFAPRLTGHEAIRQNMLALSAIEEKVTFATGRHWYVAPTVLAEWRPRTPSERPGRPCASPAAWRSTSTATDGSGQPGSGTTARRAQQLPRMACSDG